ncbi:cyclase family protein [uncultured Corynebacterium sp.]|uniref:cyclase family protein n=1 Tax=uncultured Corynebacterium sp. TaxID=159447 RepID=UPI0025EF11B8|nr:cyclase family protein [uncultured Corynebacterium sp.]
MQVIDLSHPFQPGQPHFPGDPDQIIDTIAKIKADGFLMHRYSLVGPWGTHIDAPSHFDEDGRTLDQIPAADLVLPLLVIRFNDPGLITATHLEQFETAHGPIPAGSFVAAHTGWEWGTQGTAPGWSIPALELLHHRGVTAIGHDLPDTDPSLQAQSWWLHHDHWQIENLTNLEQVPKRGATIVCNFPVPVGGASFPVRPLALIPD